MEEADPLCIRPAIMHLGKVAPIGTRAELGASIGGRGTAVEDVLIHYQVIRLNLEVVTAGHLEQDARLTDLWCSSR